MIIIAFHPSNHPALSSFQAIPAITRMEIHSCPAPQKGSAKQLPNPQAEAGYASVRHNNRSGPSSGLVLNVLNPSHRHIVRIFRWFKARVFRCFLLFSSDLRIRDYKSNLFHDVTKNHPKSQASRLREHGAIQLFRSPDLFRFPYPPVSLKRYIFHCLPRTSSELY